MMGDANDSLMRVDVAIKVFKKNPKKQTNKHKIKKKKKKKKKKNNNNNKNKNLDIGTRSIDKMDRHTKYQPCNFNSLEVTEKYQVCSSSL